MKLLDIDKLVSRYPNDPDVKQLVDGFRQSWYSLVGLRSLAESRLDVNKDPDVPIVSWKEICRKLGRVIGAMEDGKPDIIVSEETIRNSPLDLCDVLLKMR